MVVVGRFFHRRDAEVAEGRRDVGWDFGFFLGIVDDVPETLVEVCGDFLRESDTIVSAYPDFT
jgi:hypothetical protein